jgi:tetratricopeptide (TPR) repeat protein
MEPPPDRSPLGSETRGHLDRGFGFEQGGALERALDEYRAALATASSPYDQAEAHLRIARVHRTRAAWSESREESFEAIRLADEVGADDLAAEAMNVEIGSLQIRGSFEDADAMALEAIGRARSPRVRGITLQNLGRGAAERGDFESADRYFAESIAAFRAADYAIGVAIALTNSAKVALDRGDARRSIEIGHEAIAYARRLNALEIMLTTVQNQAAALVAVGDLDGAEALLTEALGHFTSARNVVRQAECLEIMGTISERRPNLETAMRCYLRSRDLALAAGDQPLVGRLTRRLERIAAPGDESEVGRPT